MIQGHGHRADGRDGVIRDQVFHPVGHQQAYLVILPDTEAVEAVCQSINLIKKPCIGHRFPLVKEKNLIRRFCGMFAQRMGNIHGSPPFFRKT